MNKLLAVLLLLVISVSAFSQSGRIPTRFSEGIRTDTVWAYSDTGFVFPYNDSLWFQKGPNSPPVNLMRGSTGGSGDMLKSTYDPDADDSVNLAEISAFAVQAGSIPWAGVVSPPDSFRAAGSTPWTGITGKPAVDYDSAWTRIGVGGGSPGDSGAITSNIGSVLWNSRSGGGLSGVDVIPSAPGYANFYMTANCYYLFGSTWYKPHAQYSLSYGSAGTGTSKGFYVYYNNSTTVGNFTSWTDIFHASAATFLSTSTTAQFTGTMTLAGLTAFTGPTEFSGDLSTPGIGSYTFSGAVFDGDQAYADTPWVSVSSHDETAPYRPTVVLAPWVSLGPDSLWPKTRINNEITAQFYARQRVDKRASDTTTTSASSAYGGLQIWIAANEVWKFKAVLKVGSSSAAGVKYAIDIPTSATLTSWTWGTTSGATAYTQEWNTADNTLTTTAFNTAGLTTAAVGAIITIEGTVVNGANAGAIKIQHAKVTSGTATIYAGSSIEAQRQN